MAVNPDPKPGRWILPLVILGMMAFTYFFVSALPEASPNTTLAGVSDTTTTTVDEGTGTTQPGGGGGGELDPATQAYLDELEAIDADLALLETELVAVNDGFDADPRTVEYSDAESRMTIVADDTQALADRVAALVVPVGLEGNQASLAAAINLCAVAGSEALEGLQSTDPGNLRRAAVAAYVQSAEDFDVELQNVKSTAGA